MHLKTHAEDSQFSLYECDKPKCKFSTMNARTFEAHTRTCIGKVSWAAYTGVVGATEAMDVEVIIHDVSVNHNTVQLIYTL
jgi:hypothetical protein